MRMTRANWPGYIADRSAYLKAVMVDEYEKTPQLYPSIFNVAPMDGYEQTYKEVAGLGLLGRIEGEEPEDWREDAFSPRWSYTIRYNWFGMAMTFTKPFMMDQLDSLGEERARALMAAAMTTEEYYAARWLNNIQSSAAEFLLPDGLAIASTAHPIKDNVLGGATTVSNFVNATLAHDSLAAASIGMKLTPNERGIPINDVAMKLVLSPQLEPRYMEITGSPLRSDTMENTGNIYKMGFMDVTPLYWRYLESEAHWTLFGRNPKLMFLRRQGIEMESERNFRKKSLAFTVETMFGIGCRSWRSIVHGYN